MRVRDIRDNVAGLYIGRPKFGDPWGYGNPFKVGRDGGTGECSPKFEAWLRTGNTFGCPDATPARRAWILLHLTAFSEKHDLLCWCHGAPYCHGHVLVKMAQEARNDPSFPHP